MRIPTLSVHNCQCLDCQHDANHPHAEHHRQINLFLSRLDEQQRRWYVALESNHIVHGGLRLLSQITGINEQTIRRGRRELAEKLASRPTDQVRIRGGGGPLTEERQPSIEAALEQMLADETAGDPMSEKKWVRSSTRQLSRRLKEQNYIASHSTVCRLLRKMDYSLKGNVARRKMVGVDSPERDRQFQYIASQKRTFIAEGLPAISVDTKKKELIGEFRSNGQVWCKKADEVNSHDFPSAAKCRAVPYGIYDLAKNKGYVFVGTSNDTPEFAVDAISRWWEHEGCVEYPGAEQLLILADSGGSNGCRLRSWKQNLQEKISDLRGLTVTVCHYPSGCSKWNPIEHRLFSQISINWAGKPLRTLEIMLGYIRGTSTVTGLSVKAFLQEGIYKKGQRVTKEEMEQLNLQSHAVCPDWNYTISPRLI